MKDMAAYLALGIIEGRLDYKSVVANPKLTKFKDDIDIILVAEGKQDLIVE